MYIYHSQFYARYESCLPDKKLQRSDKKLSERLTSLGIMGDQSMAPLKSPEHHRTIVWRGVLNLAHVMPRESFEQPTYSFFSLGCQAHIPSIKADIAEISLFQSMGCVSKIALDLECVSASRIALKYGCVLEFPCTEQD